MNQPDPDPCGFLKYCKKDCEWRKEYKNLPNQSNALRIEIITPSDRCGWRLKDNCIGGDFFDYLPCIYPKRIWND